MRKSISQTVKHQGARLMRATPTAIIIGLVSAALLPQVLPALQGAGYTAPLAAVIGGSLNVLSELGLAAITDFLLRFVERQRKKTKDGKAPSEEKVREQLEKELLEQWQSGGEEAATLRQEVSKLLQAIQGIEAALSAATEEVKQALAQGLAELGGSFEEFRWILDELKDTLAEIRNKQALQLAMQKEQLGLQREQLVKTNLLLRFQQVRAPVQPPVSPVVTEDEQEIPPADVPCPYKGLATFEPEDADYFFGREELIAELTARLAETRFLAVVGPSGSGKSSVVRAGLLPAIWRDELPSSKDWKTVVLTPGEHPLEELAIRVALLSGVAPGSLLSDLEADERGLDLAIRQVLTQGAEQVRLVLIVDQFEELFTLCRDENERHRFVEVLLTAAHAPDSRVSLVLAIRADFYGRCAAYPALASRLQDSQVLVGPLSEDELRQTIERPAAQVGLNLEPGLVETIIHDVADAPGALPLLSHALLETWDRRRGYTLTIDGYTETGGVQGAIARTADQVFDEKLSPDQQIIARNIFLRLTSIGEGTEETRRRAKREELIPQAEDKPTVEAVLKTLISTRLITTSEDTVEVAHEALIREWPKLRRWLDEDREGLRIHRHLTEAAEEWLEIDRDPGSLYRGARLAVASEWVEGHSQHMSPQEREFIDASKLLRENERKAQKRRQFFFISVMLVLVGILTTATILFNKQSKQSERIAATAQAASTLAIAQKSTAEFNAIARTTAEAQALEQFAEAQRQTDLARSRELAALAIQALQRGDVIKAYQLAVRSYRMATTLESERALYSVIAHNLPEMILEDQSCWVRSAVFSPDGKLIMTRCYNKVMVWDADSGAVLVTLRGHTDRVWSAVFSPDGKRILTASKDGTARIWDAESGDELEVLEVHTDDSLFAVFSPDGKRILTRGGDLHIQNRGGDDTVRVWDAGSGAELAVLEGHTNYVSSAVFSPDGKRILTISRDKTVRIWDAESGAELTVLEGHTGGIWSAVFSPDGMRVVTAGDWLDTTARVWDAESGAELAVLEGHTNDIWLAVFSPDGKRILTASDDGTARVWDAEGSVELVILEGHTDQVRSAVFSPDGKRILTASYDGTARLWDAESGAELDILEGHADWVSSAVFSPDGRRVLTASGDGKARVWGVDSGSETLVLEGHTDWVFSAIFSSDGRRILTASDDDTARVWGAEDGAILANLQSDDRITYYTLQSAVFNPDEKRILTVTTLNNWHYADIWDANFSTRLGGLEHHISASRPPVFSPDGKQIVTTGHNYSPRVWDAESGIELAVLEGHTFSVSSTVFSPDGKRILTASHDETARLWDAESGAELADLLGHTGYVNSAVFSPDGKRILTASNDGTARIWDAESGAELAILEGHTEVVWSAWFSPDGKKILTRSQDDTARVWNADDGAELVVIGGHAQQVSYALFSPDSTRIATINRDNTVRVWDTVSGVQLAVLEGHTDRVLSLVFSPDGKRILTASRDGTARVWATGADELLRIAEERLANLGIVVE